jgi:hypothetical protein
MNKTTEQKLLDCIFGENYGVGLPDLDSPFYWEFTDKPIEGRVNAQDIVGRWFERVIDWDEL